MLLSDRDLKAALADGRMALSPYDEAMVQPSSIDVRSTASSGCSPTTATPTSTRRSSRTTSPSWSRSPTTRRSCSTPASSSSGSTLERITLGDDLASRLEGKSSLGRLGLLTHSTAGFIDPGFSGHVTLELSNVANLPIKLYPGMRIGQICVLPAELPSEHPYGASVYGSRYQGQRGPTPSRSYLSFSRTPLA
jgi:dCTP deaminase